MEGSPDYIFSTLNIKNLERNQVEDYLVYLKKIDPQVMSTEERVRFLDYRIKLTQRLVEIDCKTVQDLKMVLAEKDQAIKIKKAKYHLV
jgi:hypothetical protein